ncbi:unnamed protein product [Meloidogyne enterolobii]|uniref:Uncharacterized protein n=1 Tax=Meloidogyne enterolobii TaxID=390850 RepID=A0ACB0Z0K3_MELEN
MEALRDIHPLCAIVKSSRISAKFCWTISRDFIVASTQFWNCFSEFRGSFMGRGNCLFCCKINSASVHDWVNCRWKA